MKSHLLAGQRRFYECDSEHKLFLGGRRSGKTHALAFEGIEASIEHGLDVLLLTQREMMAQNAVDTAREISFDQFNQMSLKTNGKLKLKYKNGGTFHANTFTRVTGGLRVNHYDLLLIDEVQEIDPDNLRSLYRYTYEMSPKLFEGFYAAGTPLDGLNEPLEFLRDEEFVFMPVSTIENSMINHEVVQEQRQRLSEVEFRKRFMVGLNVGGHMLFNIEQDGERLHQCMLCDFEEAIPLNFPDEKVSAVEGYIFGKAQKSSCNKQKV